MGHDRFNSYDNQVYCYYNLRVIFDPFKTGLEELRNFNPEVGTIIAGRYQFNEYIGQVSYYHYYIYYY